MSTYEQVWAAERPRLVGLAYRILGSWHDAEDVVSGAWTRMSSQTVLDRPEAWLTTVTTRLAIDEARRAAARRETYIGPWLPEPVATSRLPADVAADRDLLGLGLLRLLQEIEPEQRAIYVLREAFDVPYDEIAESVGRTAAGCRQIVARARRRLASARPTPDVTAGGDIDVDRRLLTALLGAVVAGDVAEASRLVSGDVVLWSDGGGVTKAALRPIAGADKVIRFLLGITRTPAAAWELVDVNGRPALWFDTVVGERIVAVERDGARVTGIQLHANPAKLRLAR